MSTEILVDTVTTTTDSCQMVATETTLQVTAATKSDNQTTANEAYTAVPPRRTFNEQKPFVFSIVGFAVVYVAALVIGRIIKMRRSSWLYCRGPQKIRLESESYLS